MPENVSRSSSPGGLASGASKLAVLGSPIAHSRSPQIHAAAYAALGLDWSYTRQQLEAEELAGFLASRGPEWRGFSLTMPLKEQAHALATELDPVAERSGVVNTLLRQGDGWFGANTDAAGLAGAITDGVAPGRLEYVAVLGAGATAVSALYAAEALGVEHVRVLARRPEAAQSLIERHARVGVELSAGSLTPSDPVLQVADLVISTLPGPAGEALAFPRELRERTPLFDAAYDPWPSPLGAAWKEADGHAVPGIDMLVLQALRQIRLFVGQDLSTPLPDEPALLSAMRLAAAPTVKE